VAQALIATYSKTKHFDPAQPTEHEPDVNGFMWDVIGLAQAITVKVFIQSTISSTPILKFV